MLQKIIDPAHQILLERFAEAGYNLIIWRVKPRSDEMSETTLGQMIRALHGDHDVEEQYRGLVEQAYAHSSQGSKPWRLTVKEREHVLCIFQSMYAEF